MPDKEGRGGKKSGSVRNDDLTITTVPQGERREDWMDKVGGRETLCTRRQQKNIANRHKEHQVPYQCQQGSLSEEITKGGE